MESGVLNHQFWVLGLGTGPTRPFSPRCLLVAAPAASTAASRCDPVAGAQGRIAAEAGHCQRKSSQRGPACSGARVAWLTSARVREVPFGVRQAVVEQALGTPQAAKAAHQQATRVGGLSAAATTPVCSAAEERAAVHATRCLLRLRGGLGWRGGWARTWGWASRGRWGRSLGERGG